MEGRPEGLEVVTLRRTLSQKKEALASNPDENTGKPGGPGGRQAF